MLHSMEAREKGELIHITQQQHDLYYKHLYVLEPWCGATLLKELNLLLVVALRMLL